MPARADQCPTAGTTASRRVAANRGAGVCASVSLVVRSLSEEAVLVHRPSANGLQLQLQALGQPLPAPLLGTVCLSCLPAFPGPFVRRGSDFAVPAHLAVCNTCTFHQLYVLTHFPLCCFQNDHTPTTFPIQFAMNLTLLGFCLESAKPAPQSNTPLGSLALVPDVGGLMIRTLVATLLCSTCKFRH